jgi:gliding motility-associated-like protein
MRLFLSLEKSKLILFFLFSSLFSVSQAQTLIINEVSNGPTGNKEYIELLVIDTAVTYNCGNTTPPCIDIRGWIIDDNSGYHGSGGIAAGANRFSQNSLWSCVPLGTLILIYNGADINSEIPPIDISLSDGNCRIIVPINNVNLFETNTTTPGALACSYPSTGWIAGGDWTSIALANTADCARIVNLNGCEVFSVCWSTTNANTLIYFNSGSSGTDNVWFFNDGEPNLQSNWSEGCADISTCGTDNQTPGSPNNLSNQNYIAQFNNNCSPITPLTLNVNSTDNTCSCNGTATVNASGSIPGYTYEWYDSDFSNLLGTTSNISGLCDGEYHVIVSSSIDCIDTVSVEIMGTGSVPIAFPTVDNPICEGDTIFLFSNTVNGANYNWTGPNGFTSSLQNPFILNSAFSNEGNYTLVIESGSCLSSPESVFADIILCNDTTVNVLDSHWIYIPNIFTPNGDTFNDAFVIHGFGILDFHLEIFNRWGQKLFTSENLLQSWNGETEGKPVPEGTYYYIIKVGYTNTDALHKGHITLKRE